MEGGGTRMNSRLRFLAGVASALFLATVFGDAIIAADARERGPLAGIGRNLQRLARAAPPGSERGRPDLAREGQRVTVNVGGERREYLLYVPSAYRPGTPIALVMAFHGGGDNIDHMARFTRYPAVAEQERFIVAIPQGVARTWNAGSGRGEGAAEDRNIDDLGFVRAMLTQIKSTYAIDPRRVYASGMSKGGMLAYYIACNMSEEIAAITVVSTTMTAARCNPSNPVAVLHIQGSADENVPLTGGRGKYTARGTSYPPVQQAIDLWRTRNSCSANITQMPLSPDTTCRVYSGCQAEVRLCLVQNGGHAWPGQDVERWQERANYYVTRSFDATVLSWQFFVQHPKS